MKIIVGGGPRSAPNDGQLSPTGGRGGGCVRTLRFPWVEGSKAGDNVAESFRLSERQLLLSTV